MYNVAMIKEYEKQLNRFMEGFRQTVRDDAEERKRLQIEIRALKAQNLNLRKRLNRKSELPEITENEEYLVGKIEQLEDELRSLKCVDKSKTNL